MGVVTDVPRVGVCYRLYGRRGACRVLLLRRCGCVCYVLRPIVAGLTGSGVNLWGQGRYASGGRVVTDVRVL